MNGQIITPFSVSFDGQKTFQPAPVPGCWDTLIRDKAWEGPVYYRAVFDAPDIASHSRWFLRFGRVSYWCRVSLNGQMLGEHEGMWDAFEIEITSCVLPRENELIVEVIKPGYDEGCRFPYRQTLAGFIPDTGVAFGGIWEEVRLIGDMGVRASNVSLADEGGETECLFAIDRDCEVTVTVRDGGQAVAAISAKAEKGLVRLRVPKALVPWSPAQPKLYDVEIVAFVGGTCAFCKVFAAGIRCTTASGARIVIGGEPCYLRGVLNWGWRPEIAAYATRDEATASFEALRRMGLNLVKCCLYIPSEAYLSQADRDGMLLWVELPLWFPDMTEATVGRIHDQYPKMLAALSCHPSVIMVSLGCELDDRVPPELLEALYRLTRSAMPGALVRDNSGSGECYGGYQQDFADFYDYHFYCDLPHIQPLMDEFTASYRPSRPWVFGEYCDADTVRDVRGRTDWYFINDKRANPLSTNHGGVWIDQFPALYGGESNLPAEAPPRLAELERLSYRHAMIHRKYTVEATRTYAEISGYVLTSIRDCPLATSGLFDDTGAPKFDDRAMRAFNGERVLSLTRPLSAPWVTGGNRLNHPDLYSGFIGETHSLYPVFSNHGAAIESASLHWQLTLHGETAHTGELSAGEIRQGDIRRLPLIAFRWDTPGAYTLKVQLVDIDGRPLCENEFPLWAHRPGNGEGFCFHDPSPGWQKAFPNAIAWREGEPCRLLVSAALDKAVLGFVEKGGHCLYLAQSNPALPALPAPFWRESCPVLCDHPLIQTLHLLPGDTTDLFFYSLTADSVFQPAELSTALPGAAITPIIERFDARTYAYRLYAFEAALGKGRLIATTLRVTSGPGRVPQTLDTSAAGRALILAAAEVMGEGWAGER